MSRVGMNMRSGPYALFRQNVDPDKKRGQELRSSGRQLGTGRPDMGTWVGVEATLSRCPTCWVPLLIVEDSFLSYNGVQGGFEEL